MKKSNYLVLITFLAIVFTSCGSPHPNTDITEQQSEEDNFPVGETFLIKDIYQGKGSSALSSLTVFKNKLYLIAWEDVLYSNLWIFDGKQETIIAPWTTSTDGKNLYCLSVWNDTLYYGADQFVENKTQASFWKYTGNGNPEPISDLKPTKNGIWYKNKLYLTQQNENSEYELYKYQPETGLQLAADIGIDTSSNPENFTIYMDKLYFTAFDATHGTELWMYDEENGAELVMDINPGSKSSDPKNLYVYNNELFFTANSSYYNSFFKYNITDKCVDMTDDNNTKIGASNNFQNFDDKLYFLSNPGMYNTCIWSYDNEGNLNKVLDFKDGVFLNGTAYEMTIYKNTIFFSGGDALGGSLELYKYNPDDGIKCLSDFNVTNGPRLEKLTVFNDILCFAAKSNRYGFELWGYRE
ncbi:MAG: hypothetical protein JXR64_13005 [Spirochaetales bacterium]|nr:hypothetical protein [Spirochaetales bacterium]